MPRLATAAEVRARLETKRVSNDIDPVLNPIIDGVETFAEKYTGRRFSPEPALVGDPPADTEPPVTKAYRIVRGQRRRGEPHTIRVKGDLRVLVSIDLDGVALIDGTDITLGDYSATSPATHLTLYEAPRLSTLDPEATLSITGRWGFNPVPGDVKDAVIALACRRYHEKDASWGDVVQTPEGGAISYFAGTPRWVKEAFDGYRIPRIGFIGQPVGAAA